MADDNFNTKGSDYDRWKRQMDERRGSTGKEEDVDIKNWMVNLREQQIDERKRLAKDLLKKASEDYGRPAAFVCREYGCGWEGDNPTGNLSELSESADCPKCGKTVYIREATNPTPDWLRSLVACTFWLGGWGFAGTQVLSNKGREPGEIPFGSIEAMIAVLFISVFVVPGLGFWWYNKYK